MDSGIYRDLSNNVDIVAFGGRIGMEMSISKDKSNGYLWFRVLENKYTPGSTISEEDRKTGAQVALYFDNTTSIELLIDNLQFIKDHLSGMSEKELDEKYKERIVYRPETTIITHELP